MSAAHSLAPVRRAGLEKLQPPLFEPTIVTWRNCSGWRRCPAKQGTIRQIDGQTHQPGRLRTAESNHLCCDITAERLVGRAARDRRSQSGRRDAREVALTVRFVRILVVEAGCEMN